MREGTSKHLALLAVELYEISEKFVYELNNKQHDSQNVFDHLPEFAINGNETANKQPIPARYYHQFMGQLEPDGDGEKFLFFNLGTQDSVLQEEINNSGYDDLFQDIDFEQVLNNFTPEPQENITGFVIPKTNYLVVELTYITSYDHYSGGYEYDMEIDIVGYLDYNLQRKPFKPDNEGMCAQRFKKDDIVRIPHNGSGRILKYIDLPWASRYEVQILEQHPLYDVGTVEDFFEKDLELGKE